MADDTPYAAKPLNLWSLGKNQDQINNYINFFFFLGFMARQDNFEPSQSLAGAKTGDSREKHLTTR